VAGAVAGLVQGGLDSEHYYPPAILLLILFVFVASLYFSVVVSGQRGQIAPWGLAG
jgi:hypothetical protein